MHKTESNYTYYTLKIIKRTPPVFYQGPLQFDAFQEEISECTHIPFRLPKMNYVYLGKSGEGARHKNPNYGVVRELEKKIKDWEQ